MKDAGEGIVLAVFEVDAAQFLKLQAGGEVEASALAGHAVVDLQVALSQVHLDGAMTQAAGAVWIDFDHGDRKDRIRMIRGGVDLVRF